jgi:energy-converting hydrogenase Eha subunit G
VVLERAVLGASVTVTLLTRLARVATDTANVLPALTYSGAELVTASTAFGQLGMSYCADA